MRAQEFIPFFLLVLLMLAATMTFIWALQLRYKRRELLHKERVAALEKGMDLPSLGEVADKAHAPWSPRQYLLRGLMWLFTGIAVSVFVLGVSLSTQRPESPETRLWRIQRMREMGASEEQLKTLGAEGSRNEGMPAAVALFGLIPMAVGAAYLVVYNTERKQLPPA